MERELIERAERAIATIYQSLEKHGKKVSPIISSDIIGLLENPPQNFFAHIRK
jgi:hypothetical protein